MFWFSSFLGTNLTSSEDTAVNDEEIKFVGLSPSSEYQCAGEMTFDGKTFPIPPQTFVTRDGIPESPEGPIAATEVGHDRAILLWQPPAVTNGKIQFYKIVLSPECKEAHNTGAAPSKYDT